MIIGVLNLELGIYHAQSLKDKRSIMKSLIRRLQNKFNAAIAEVADHDLWQKGALGVAVVGNSTAHVHSQLQSIVDFVESQPSVNIIAIETEIL